MKVCVSVKRIIAIASVKYGILTRTTFNYTDEKCGETCKVLSDLIRNKLKGLGFERYKFIVQVVIGERREQGVRYANCQQPAQLI